jgi:O-antigen ligase
VRVAKGFAAATALLPFLGHSFRSRDDAFRLFASGMVTGLTLVGLAVLLERALFPGVFDFASDYRVAGPFASMHVGGAHLPAYLALALPFTAVIVVVPRRRALIGAMTLGALCLGVYALIVTFNRTAYAAAGLTLVTLFVGLFYAVRADPRWRRITAAVAVTVGSAAAAAVGIALLSPIMRERFATTEADTAVRLDDWRAGLALRDRSWTTSIFGMGLGSFPRNYLFAAGDNDRPATFSLRTRDGQSFLRLGAGTASYLGQKIDVGPDLAYDLKVTLRANDDRAALLVLLCEKYLIYSVNCVEKSLQPAASSAWTETGAQLDSGEIGQPPIAALPWLRRPAELVLVNARPGTILEIARVQLLDPNARDVVANGDFSAGLSRWLFTNDNHLAWRIKSLWVMSLFEQGWFGLLALVAFLGATFRHLIGAMRAGDRAAPIVFAALIGFCAMGLTDGLIEVPRLTALFYLVMFAGLCLGRGARADARTARPQTDVSVRPTRPDRPVPTRHPPSKTAVRP